MQSLKGSLPPALPACLLLAALAIGSGVLVCPSVAQERRSEQNDDSSDSRDRRRSSGSWWRDRDNRRDDRDNDDRRSGSTGSESSNSSSGDANFTAENWAKSLVKKHDKNSNSMLDGAELDAAGRQASQADANKDKVVTIDELVIQAGGKSDPSASSTAAATKSAEESTAKPPEGEKKSGENEGGDRDRGDRGRDSGIVSPGSAKSAAPSKRVYTWTGNSGSSANENKRERRTYRFTPARERLPSELPSWFKSQDKNGDGQVAMSEYSRSWSKSTVARFQGYDKDGDGVVTAKEAAGKK
jgi:hypothetical protein